MQAWFTRKKKYKEAPLDASDSTSLPNIFNAPPDQMILNLKYVVYISLLLPFEGCMEECLHFFPFFQITWPKSNNLNKQLDFNILSTIQGHLQM